VTRFATKTKIYSFDPIKLVNKLWTGSLKNNTDASAILNNLGVSATIVHELKIWK